jgi:hypothetical protein
MRVMLRRGLLILSLTPVMWAFVLLLMSVENPFSIAFSAILLTAQVPLIRWILEHEALRLKNVRISS